MRLTRLFAFTTVVLITLIGLMLSRIVFGEWSVYHSADAGLRAMEVAYKAMVVAEKVSFERGPTNGVLGDGDNPDPSKRARLVLAREASDAAIVELAAMMEPAQHQDEAVLALQKARVQLIAARAEVDQVARLPRAGRQPERVMGAVHQMFDVIPVVMEVVTLLSRDAETIYPQFSDALVGARLAAELREYAGRLGSQFTAALTEQKPLADTEQQAIHVLRGRIEQLRILIELPTRTRETDERILAAVRDMEHRYFGDGLAFIAQVERASSEGRSYGIDTAEFAARYVPDMASIVKMRDVLVSIAIEGGRERKASARKALALISVLGAATLLTVLLILLVIQRRVVGPLLEATSVVVDIARGRLDAEIPVSRREDEIGDMLQAVALLKENSIERHRLEEERGALIEELKQASNTDFLTGLLNRRAFTAIADGQIGAARRHGWPLALILYDIDHFKKVNDRHGHATGDAVLVAIAQLSKRMFRDGDFVARHGGEEFVALAPHCDVEAALVLAERLRAAIEAADIELPGGDSPGGTLRVTASFGVVALRHPVDDLDALLQGADHALYAAKDAGRNRVMRGAPRFIAEPGAAP
jgi:diguanylate cyclase (GGDEF)-like protein